MSDAHQLILRGEDLARRLESVFRDPLPSHPDERARYRNILMPGLTGGEHQWALLGVIGQALRVRGARATALMCDSLVPACTLQKVDHHELACTRWCHKHSRLLADAVGLPYRWYSEFVSHDRMAQLRREADAVPRDELLSQTYRGIALGELMKRSLESYFKLGTTDLDDPAIEERARAFLASARALVEIAEQAFDEYEIDKVLLDDGGKTDWGVFRAVARKRGIPVDVVGVGIRGTSIRFEVDRPGRGTLRMPGWDRWRDVPLTPDQDERLDAYLQRRETVPYEYRSGHWRAGSTDAAALARDLGVADRAPGSRLLAMFPNVGFDAGKTKSAEAAYATAQAWVQATARAMAPYPEHHLVIKKHPAEHHRESRDSSLDGLGDLPPNVHLIPGDTDVSASAVARLADVVLTYTSTVSVEAAALGIPVVLAGGGWHAGRGVFAEVHTPEEHLDWLERICARNELPPIDRDVARRYAWSLFFRNDIPVTHLRRHDVHVADVLLESTADLAPGVHPSIDAICRGVMSDDPFANPDVEAAPCGVGAA